MKSLFNVPYKSNNELLYIQDAIQLGKTGGDGCYTALCQRKLEEVLKSNKILMTTSCTHALELVFELIELKDFEVIMPSYNYPSTANSVLLKGGKVVFTEVNKENLCIDVHKIEEKITPKTKAILVVHYGGTSCDMEPIMALADKYHLYVVEDVAQGFLSSYKNKWLGTIGHFGCYSFHETKNINCGEGGALSINSIDHSLIEKAENIRQKGTNRSAYDRGEVAFYEWVSKGSSYSPSEILMAYLFAQLEVAELLQMRRRDLFQHYYKLFQATAYPSIEAFSSGNMYGAFNAHIFYVIFKTENYARCFMEQLRSNNINAYTHFIPLHLSKMGKNLGYHKEDFPYEASVCKRLVRLPIHSMMEQDTIDFTMKEIHEVLMRLK